jgi:hypothetical protein
MRVHWTPQEGHRPFKRLEKEWKERAAVNNNNSEQYACLYSQQLHLPGASPRLLGTELIHHLLLLSPVKHPIITHTCAINTPL